MDRLKPCPGTRSSCRRSTSPKSRRGIVHAADGPGRREYLVGASTRATILANRVLPGLLDRYLARTG
jgi:hypothetical protein